MGSIQMDRITRWEKNQRVIFFLSGLAAAWLAGFFAVFLVNKSAGSLHLEIFLTLGDRVLQILAAGLIFIFAYSLGKTFFRLFPFRFSSPGIAFVFTEAVGLWLVSLLVLAAGLAGIMNRAFYRFLFLGILVVFLFRLRRRRAGTTGILPVEKAGRGILAGVPFLFLILPFFLLAFAGSLTPPTSYDTLEYHLGAPSEYLKAGRITFLEGNVYSNFPGMMEMLYLLGLILKDDVTAKLVHFFLGAGTALAVYHLARRYFSPVAALAAALIFYSYGQVNLLASQAYVDLGVTFFSLLSLAAFLNWLTGEESGRRSWLALSGLLAGIAGSCKYSALLLHFLPLAAMTAAVSFFFRPATAGSCRDKGCCFRRAAGGVLVFLLPALAALSPWLVKNLCFTGNPVYPFGFEWFGGRGWDRFLADRFLARHTGAERGIAGFFLSPFTVSFSDNLASPLFLLFVLPALAWFGPLVPRAGRERKKVVGVLFAYVFVYYSLWYLFTHQQVRFLVPAAAPLAILAGAGFRRTQEWKPVRLLAGMIFLAGLGYNLFAAAAVQAERGPLAVISGYESRDEFLLRGFQAYPAIKFMNENLDAGAKILFVGEARVYYSKKKVLANTVFDRSFIAETTAGCASPEEILPKLRARGITHVFLNLAEVSRLHRMYGYLDDFDWQLFRELEKQYLERLFADERRGLFVYRINYPQ